MEKEEMVEERKQGTKRERDENEEFKLIPLRNKGGEIVAYAKCSLEDYDELNKYKWSMHKAGYGIGTIGIKKYLMHRFIKLYLEKIIIPKESLIDHANGNRIDNRRTNLRVATFAQNGLNKKRKSNSKFYGVNYRERENKYQARARVAGKYIVIGSFDNEIEAAEMYDIWAIHQSNFNEGFRKLNFPEKKNEYLNIKLPEKYQKSSQYIGVSKLKSGKFSAQITTKQKNIYLLTSFDEIECAKIYDEYIYKNKLDKQMNFPEHFPDHYINVNKEIKTEMCQIDENTARLIIKNKPDVCVFIDTNDYEHVKYEGLHINYGGYVSFNKKKNGNNLLHRYLLDMQDTSMHVDHINNVKTDCRRKNLRIVTPKENAQNRSKKPNATSKYFGVSFKKQDSRFISRLYINGESLFTKSFKSEEDAARHRDLCVFKHYPNSLFKMNFTWTSEEKEEWTKKLNL